MTRDPGRSRPATAYRQRAESLLALLRTHFGLPRAGRTVIAVAGESGSGKSVTAIDLAAMLDEAGIASAIIHQDNYFVRPPRTNHDFRVADITSVGPQEVQMDLIAAHIAAFRAGAPSVTAPVVDYPGNRFLTQVLDFSATQVLVVEGTFALLLDDADIRIFLEATYLDTRQRRQLRARDVDDPFVEQVLDIEHRIIAAQAPRADILIDSDYAVRLRSAT
ncbi:MAG: hypothetical protein IT355_02810 [Gemmatimonadaceae bacterium]|nr:hypothetical protein [Gemmatimonadaceae bacterium]